MGGDGECCGTAHTMSETNSIPSLQSDTTVETVYDYGSRDLVKFRFCNILAQIELASCFRNDVEPRMLGHV
jgi:hypothetical protein